MARPWRKAAFLTAVLTDHCLLNAMVRTLCNVILLKLERSLVLPPLLQIHGRSVWLLALLNYLITFSQLSPSPNDNTLVFVVNQINCFRVASIPLCLAFTPLAHLCCLFGMKTHHLASRFSRFVVIWSCSSGWFCAAGFLSPIFAIFLRGLSSFSIATVTTRHESHLTRRESWMFTIVNGDGDNYR